MKDRTVNIVLIVALVISTGLDIVVQFTLDRRAAQDERNTVTAELNKAVTRYQSCEKREEDLTAIIEDLTKEMVK